jgi:hypothetical protein
VLRRATMIAALLALAASHVPQKRATILRSGEIAITLPERLIRSSEVKKQLTSGLTTVFIVAVTAKDSEGSARGGARIDVRLDLWEETYLVTMIGPNGEAQKLSLRSAEALEQWWSENALVVTSPNKWDRSVSVDVKLKMLPFSSKEQSDTQRWLSRTLSGSGGGSGERTPAQSAEILRIIVETSVRRRPLLEESWTVKAEPEGR